MKLRIFIIIYSILTISIHQAKSNEPFVVLDYNLNPIEKKKGSAVFMHIATKSYSPTLGCIAISKNDLKYLLSIINKKTYLKIL